MRCVIIHRRNRRQDAHISVEVRTVPFAIDAVRASPHPTALQLNPNNPLGRRSGAGRNPAIKNTPRSGQNYNVVPLTWVIFNHLDTGLRRYDAFFIMDYPG